MFKKIRALWQARQSRRMAEFLESRVSREPEPVYDPYTEPTASCGSSSDESDPDDRCWA